jgi:internalin A
MVSPEAEFGMVSPEPSLLRVVAGRGTLLIPSMYVFIVDGITLQFPGIYGLLSRRPCATWGSGNAIERLSQETGMHDPSSAANKRRRFRARLSLRAMIIFVVVVGCSLGWVVHRVRVQRDAVAALMRPGPGGAVVLYDWEYTDGRYIPGGKPWWPRWVVEPVGVDYFGSVSRVFLGWHGSDADLGHIGDLYQLEELIFTQSSSTDAGLAHLERLTQLRRLDLSKSGVTDAGTARLRGLTGVRWLSLKDCPVSDAGLANIRRLTRMELLGLNGTNITDAGLANLTGLSSMKHLYLTRTKITDAGLAHLKGLSGLQTLYLNDTNVTDNGLARLKGMTQLSTLNLAGTWVTDVGVQDFQKALPMVRITR